MAEEYKGGKRLVAAMRKCGRTPDTEVASFIVGKVTSDSPLEININDEIYDESFFTLSPFVDPSYEITTKVEMDVTVHTEIGENTYTGTGKNEGEGKVKKDFRKLEIGDKVLLIRLDRGQSYYVLQKLNKPKSE